MGVDSDKMQSTCDNFLVEYNSSMIKWKDLAPTVHESIRHAKGKLVQKQLNTYIFHKKIQ